MDQVDIASRALTLLAPNVESGFRVDPVAVARNLGLAIRLAGFAEQDLMGVLARGDQGTSIVVRADADFVVQRFLVAHLAGHAVLHPEEIGDVPEWGSPERFFFDHAGALQEIQANQFALELLMPPRLLYKMMKGIPSPPLLAQVLGVSLDALVFRWFSLVPRERVG